MTGLVPGWTPDRARPGPFVPARPSGCSPRSAGHVRSSRAVGLLAVLGQDPVAHAGEGSGHRARGPAEGGGRELSGAGLGGEGVRVGELPEAFLALLAPVTAVSATAEWHRRVDGEHEGVVDAGHSDTESTGDG